MSENVVKQPSVGKIIKLYDYALLLAMFTVVFFGLFIAVDVFGITIRRRGTSISRSDIPIFLFLTLATAIFTAVALWWRVGTVRRVFADGQEVAGRITNVALNQTNSGYVHYSYVFDNREYRNKIGVAGRLVGQQALRMFRVGNEIALIVDRTNPKRAFIRDLYL